MALMKWYALHSHPRSEEALYRHVTGLGVECFYPRIRVHPVNPRARKMLPYFPRYVFIHVEPSTTSGSLFKWMPFSSGLVTFGDEPAEVPGAIIDSLHRLLDGLNQSPPTDGMKAGDELVIQSGVFAGYDAIFDVRINGSQRVRVLLKLLSQGRDLPVELPASQVRPRKNGY